MMMLEQVGKNVKMVSDNVTQAGRTAWLLGLGLAATVEEETRCAIEKLIKKGESFKIEIPMKNQVNQLRQGLTERVTTTGKQVESVFRSRFQSGLTRVGIPSNDEISTLITRVEQLNKKVKEIQ